MAHQCPQWSYPQDVQPQDLREEQWIKLQPEEDEDGWAGSWRRLVGCEPSQEQKASLGNNITSIHPQLSSQPANSLWDLVIVRNYSRYSKSGAGKHHSAPFFKTSVAISTPLPLFRLVLNPGYQISLWLEWEQSISFSRVGRMWNPHLTCSMFPLSSQSFRLLSKPITPVWWEIMNLYLPSL